MRANPSNAFMIRHCIFAMVLPGMLLISGCAVPNPSDDALPDAVQHNAWAHQSVTQGSRMDSAAGPWQHYQLPGKRPTSFTYSRKDGRNTMAVLAQSSASMLRKKVLVAPQDLSQLHFSWLVPELIAQADMALRDADDAPVRIVLAFDGDRSRFTAKNAMLSELSLALTGEPLPYATLMYVWCNTRAPGTVILNPRTDRIRKLVVESGAARLNQWLEYERDIRADFQHAFGEEPGALVGIGIMTDSDNTQSQTRAWYGPVRLAFRKPN